MSASKIMQFFSYNHLPADKQAISKPFGDLAKEMFDLLPDNVERDEMVRKLLEAKDCAVRAKIYRDADAPFKIIVNGEEITTERKTLTYEELCVVARQQEGATAVYKTPGGQGATLYRGKKVDLVDGMIFDVIMTGNA